MKEQIEQTREYYIRQQLCLKEQIDTIHTIKIEEIQRRREEAGLSRCQLSQAAGLPKNALSRIEYRQTSYTYPIRARAIAKALHCKLTDIFDDVPGK